MDTLPIDILSIIATYCKTPNEWSLVCRKFHQSTQNTTFWKYSILQMNPNFNLLIEPSRLQNIYFKMRHSKLKEKIDSKIESLNKIQNKITIDTQLRQNVIAECGKIPTHSILNTGFPINDDRVKQYYTFSEFYELYGVVSPIESYSLYSIFTIWYANNVSLAYMIIDKNKIYKAGLTADQKSWIWPYKFGLFIDKLGMTNYDLVNLYDIKGIHCYFADPENKFYSEISYY